MGKRCDRVYFGSNTKMSKTDSETAGFVEALIKETRKLWDMPISLFVIPSFTALNGAGKLLGDTPVLLGAQNMCYEERGAFTGEVSPLSLVENGVRIAEIGHSERRHVFGETDSDAHKKVFLALKTGLIPLLCIGETAHDKAAGISDEALSIQLKEAFAGLGEEAAQAALVAYEPVWAIGEHGVCAEPEYVQQRHESIKETLCALFGREAGMDVPVLYGGSVNGENAALLMGCQHVNGLFVGRAAWTADGYAHIAELALNSYLARACR